MHHDEPTSEDRLNREFYANALARLCGTCETPLVVGIYASWGVGKTSLMKLIERQLDVQRTRSIWFNAWENQEVESPALALAHAVANEVEKPAAREAKKLLTLIALAFGSKVLHSATGLSVADLLKLGRRYEDEHFQVRSAKLKLRDHFQALIAQALGSDRESKRLVFFIDDLDRCTPDRAFSMLEALKLYLNVEGCVYFVALDRDVIGRTTRSRQQFDLNEREYLDKIIQLPFTVPAIEPGCMRRFVEPLLAPGLQTCLPMLVAGLGDNPRHVKRFVNVLTLCHELATEINIPRYDARILALLLLIQERQPDLFREVLRAPDLITTLRMSSPENELYKKHVADDERLQQAWVALPADELRSSHLKYYFYLAQPSVGHGPGIDLPPIGRVESHRLRGRYVLWVDDAGRGGSEGIESLLQGMGVHLRIVTSTQQAEEVIAAKEPDLIVSDIARGDVNDEGLRMAEGFRRDGYYSGPIIFYCGDVGHGRLGRASQIGALIFTQPGPLLDEVKLQLENRRREDR